MAPSADTSFASHVAGQLTFYERDRKAVSKDSLYTTSNGVPMSHPYEMQRVGENDPFLLQDFYLIDLLGQRCSRFLRVHQPHPKLDSGRRLLGEGQEVPRDGAILDRRRRVWLTRLRERPQWFRRQIQDWGR